MASKAKAGKGDGSWKETFLTALANSANIRAACKAAGIARCTAYEAKEKDLAFAAKWEVALTEALELLEAAAFRRAIQSSDTLMMFLLRAHNPLKYREERHLNLKGNVQTDIVVDLVAVGGEEEE